MVLCPHCRRGQLREDGSCTRCYYVPDPTRDYAPGEPDHDEHEDDVPWRFLVVWMLLWAIIIAALVLRSCAS